MDYNQTVHLPQTDFPMRAGLPKREPEMLQEMYDHDLYHKMVKRNEGKPTFVLHDGPPYANGNIHIGTALNKILKDMIVKHRNMTGYCAPYVPGWDTHGLPIESAVLKDKKVKRDEMTTAQFRTKCREYAESYIEKMTGQFQRLGVLGEWENPYITLLPEFEAKQIEVFGKMAEKGLIYKGMKPVYWCPFDQTALAEAEIEYADDPCTTIFVKFPWPTTRASWASMPTWSRTYFVIWTTTPWTIPGNYAICLNAEFDYVLLQVPGGDVYVLAKDLAESVCKAAGIDYAACTVLATLKGSAFELMRAKHPLFDRESVILNGEHVTLDAGSGCVHTAPGFGAEDFQICQQYDKAEEQYLTAKALAAQLYFDTGRDDAMAALEQMYADQSEQQAQEDEKAQETAQAQTAAASVLAEGDAAFSKGDYEGARAFYTTALQKYTELEDQAQIDAINVKLAAVDSKLSVQAGLAAEAEGYMRQAESQYADKNYVQAKKYYLLAKDVYAELENDSKVSEVTRKLELIEMGISEEEQAAREAEESRESGGGSKQQAP